MSPQQKFSKNSGAFSMSCQFEGISITTDFEADPHPGSLTTVHANSAHSAYERLALMVMQGGVQLGKAEIMDYLKEVIPVVVQLARGPDGRRVVSEIRYSKATRKAQS
jgi:type IV secretory pathway ATPase VirB11/archaellum biosynthesis ATPase